jgi:cadmium resistance protein CadD (predicted permease)
MSAALAMALSAGLAQILTNLDNLALLFAMLPALGARAAVASYMAAQAIVVTAAFLLAEGLGPLGGGLAGYIGLFPLGLGLWSLWSRHRRGDAPAAPPMPAGAGAGLAVLMFLGLSGDSFAVLAPLLLDSTPPLRLAAAAGAGGAVLLMGGAALALSRMAGRAEAISRRADLLAPYVMIAAGIYVLLDTATDRI